jgi:hypothetical protein
LLRIASRRRDFSNASFPPETIAIMRRADEARPSYDTSRDAAAAVTIMVGAEAATIAVGADR